MLSGPNLRFFFTLYSESSVQARERYERGPGVRFTAEIWLIHVDRHHMASRCFQRGELL